MIVSLLSLSRSDCTALKITDQYSIHRVVYSLFPQEDGKSREFLFADKGGSINERRILLLSETEPNTPEYGSIQMKRMPENYLMAELYGFEVLVNPVRRDSKTGKLMPIRGSESLRQWFIEKVPTYGFAIDADTFCVSDTDIMRFIKDGQTVTFGKARFSGKLVVTDRERFIKTIKHGVGKAKGFGFGLLQVVPLNKASVDA